MSTVPLTALLRRMRQLEITLWVVITAALPAMVADRGVALAAHQTGIVLACGTAGSTVRCSRASGHWSTPRPCETCSIFGATAKRTKS